MLIFSGCFSGLSDEARADFRVMKDIAVYTRVSPQSRADTLMKFLDRIKKYGHFHCENWGKFTYGGQ